MEVLQPTINNTDHADQTLQFKNIFRIDIEENTNGKSESKWSTLPEHLLVNVMLYLPPKDRLKVAIVCKRWYDSFRSPYIWRHVELKYFEENDEKQLKCIEQHGEFIHRLYIQLDQSVKANRDCTISTLKHLSDLESRRLQVLRIRFRAQNPLFYSGEEFVNILYSLFQPPKIVDRTYLQLEEVDFGGFSVAYDDRVFNTLVDNHPRLRKLNIQNRMLVGKVTPECVLNIVKKCRRLSDFRLFYSSISDDVILELAKPDRDPIQFLSFICRRNEKFIKALSPESWTTLTDACPKLTVGLTFDHTIAVHKIWAIMIPQVPVSVLRLETFTQLIEEIDHVGRIYQHCLKKILVQTSESKSLNRALIDLARNCENLEAMFVYCLISQETVEQILELRPKLKERGDYVLKYEKEAHPWGSPNQIERLFIDHLWPW